MRLIAGELPDFLPETADVRAADWRISPVPEYLQDRRVEITGPVDRKMIINALNSGASVFMADLEDANSPTWTNNVDGQRNLYDAVRKTIAFTSPEGKAVCAERESCDPVRAATRVASGREARPACGRARFRIAVRFRSVLLP